MPHKTMLLVFNPKAGQQLFSPNLYEVVETFTQAGYLVTAFPTQAQGQAREIIAARAQDYDALVCAGGDGTLNEAVEGLMLCENPPPFGVIPAGTTNDFATSLGLPKDLLEAAAIIAQGEPRCLDIGLFEEDYFSYVAAFGLFTDVSYATPQSKKNILGHMAYLLEGIKRLGSIHSYPCQIDLGAERLEGDFIFGMITNALSVGGFKLPAERNIKMDDGLFEVVLLQKPSSFFDLQSIIASLLNQEKYSDSLIIRRAGKVVVSSEAPLAWTLDGEFGGEFQTATITNCHRSIQVLMPKQAEG